MGTAPHEPGHALRMGARVAVRYRLPGGSASGYTDVVGVVTALDAAQVTVASRRGLVTVDRDDVVAARAVPPPPTRPGHPHLVIGVADLERVMAEGWVALERDDLGAWQLRASSGLTRRANSVLPLGDSGMPVEQAVDVVERWYAGRGLPTLFHLDLPAGGVAGDDPLGSFLLARGYAVEHRTLVMTGAAAAIRAADDGPSSVTADGELSVGWLQAYARQRAVLPGVTEQLLTGSAGQLFLSVTDEDDTVRGLLRMSIHPGWAGIHALWVDPARRHRGHGTALVRAVTTLASQHRMSSVYLQVLAENACAIGLFESLGLTGHHDYVYLSRRLG